MEFFLSALQSCVAYCFTAELSLLLDVFTSPQSHVQLTKAALEVVKLERFFGSPTLNVTVLFCNTNVNMLISRDCMTAFC